MITANPELHSAHAGCGTLASCADAAIFCGRSGSPVSRSPRRGWSLRSSPASRTRSTRSNTTRPLRPSARSAGSRRGRWDPCGRRARRRKYADFVGTKPASEAALPEAIRREVSGLPPAKTEKQGKTGGRDAAIWLSAVAYASNNPEESAYFVSSRPAYQGGAPRCS
ncbi:PIN domain-containing protein [Streptomyces sp. NPDC007863]|uniref:PIN domain-containing protein n=1 Tax=Streptomyces sp. NPDC007863 TaxID=3154894 RepID=UPI0033DBEB91